MLSSKVEAIKEIDVRTKVRDVWKFVGLINYFSYMWRKYAHTLYPLSKLCSPKGNLKWTDIENNAFIAMKMKVGRDDLLFTLTLAKSL